MVIVNKNQIHYGHLGESKLYFFVKAAKKLYRLPRDNSYFQTLLDMGMITEQETEFDPEKSRLPHLLPGAVCFTPDVYVGPVLVASGDIFLLCELELPHSINEADLLQVLNDSSLLPEEKCGEIHLLSGDHWPENTSVQIIQISPSVTKPTASHRLTSVPAAEISSPDFFPLQLLSPEPEKSAPDEPESPGSPHYDSPRNAIPASSFITNHPVLLRVIGASAVCVVVVFILFFIFSKTNSDTKPVEKFTIKKPAPPATKSTPEQPLPGNRNILFEQHTSAEKQSHETRKSDQNKNKVKSNKLIIKTSIIHGQEKYGFVNEEGKQVVPCIYDKAGNYSEGLAAVRTGAGWGYINQRGTLVIPTVYAIATQFHEGLAGVMKYREINDTKRQSWGFIDKTGKEIISLQYDNVNAFTDGRAKVVMEGNSYVIDKKGNIKSTLNNPTP